MADPLDPVIHQLRHLVWTVIVPLIFVGAMAGLLFRFCMAKFAAALVRFFRKIR